MVVYNYFVSWNTAQLIYFAEFFGIKIVNILKGEKVREKKFVHPGGGVAGALNCLKKISQKNSMGDENSQT